MPNLIKENLQCSIAQSLYREIVSRNSKYFYYLGGTDSDVSEIRDSLFSEKSIRDNIVLLKGVNPTDTALIIPRIDWISGSIYDQYDDRVSDAVLGINLIDPGVGYSSTPIINISGGNGSGATAEAILDVNGSIKEIVMTAGGKGYTGNPVVDIVGSVNATGRAAIARVVVNKTVDGNYKIEDGKFVIVTNDYRVYKCIGNNNRAQSIVKPIFTGPDVFTTSDGYSWKFLYRIPPNMINKFVTPDYIPVINSLSDNYYDIGSISRLNIDSGGSGYQLADTRILIEGDGHLASNPLLIKSVTILNGGALYSPSTIVAFDSPIDGYYKEWSPDINVKRGDIIKYQSFFYNVVSDGKMSSTPPNSTIPGEHVVNGETFLEFVGENLECRLTVTSGEITNAELLGRIYSIDITDGGSGYNVGQLPLVIKKYDDTNACTGIASCFDGRVQEITVINNNEKITSLSEIEYYSIGYKFLSNFEYSANVHVASGDNLYLTVGVGQAESLNHTSGIVGVFKYVGKSAKIQPVLQYGYGYKVTPEYSIVGDSGSGATLSLQTEKSEAKVVPIISDGSIVDYVVIDGGVGYTRAKVSVISNSGINAVMQANVFVGSIDTLESNNHLASIVGGIHNIQMISAGSGYDPTIGIPMISIVGDGEGAKAHAILEIDSDSNGSGAGEVGEVQTYRLTRIVIDDPGKNYTYAKVIISNTPVGTGAQARAIISPYGGHGRDNIKELFASKVMVYAKLQNEKFSGFTVENDYRIFGLIKNPKNYDDSAYISSSLASSCYVVYSLFDASKFISDSIINVVGNIEKRFKIISTAKNAMILQDLNNYKLNIDDKLEISVAGIKYTTQVLSFVEPTFGKYTGEILNVNYKPSGFSSSPSQSIVIRSILGLSV